MLAGDVHCTFPTVRLVSLILLRSAPFPSSAGSSISARSSCRSELSSIVNSGSVNLISLQKRERGECVLSGVKARCLGSSGERAYENTCEKCSGCGGRHLPRTEWWWYCFHVGSHPKSALGTLLNPRSPHFMCPVLSAVERHLLVSL